MTPSLLWPPPLAWLTMTPRPTWSSQLTPAPEPWPRCSTTCAKASRPPGLLQQKDISCGISSAQDADSSIASSANDTSLIVQRIHLPGASLPVWCDTSTNHPRTWLPDAWRLRCLLPVHNLSRPSGRASLRILSRNFVWPGMARDVKRWTRAFESC